MLMIKKEMKSVIKEIRGIHTDSKKIIGFVLIFFNILVIAGAAVSFFPQLAGNEVTAGFIVDDFLSAACRTLSLGFSGALLIDLMTRKNRAEG